MKHLKLLTPLLLLGLLLPVSGGMLLTGCAATDHRESTGEYIDDSSITTRVKTAIFNDPELHVTQISVETYQGVVQLSGFVDDHSQVKKAGQDARQVEGVKSVKNDLRVK